MRVVQEITPLSATEAHNMVMLKRANDLARLLRPSRCWQGAGWCLTAVGCYSGVVLSVMVPDYFDWWSRLPSTLQQVTVLAVAIAFCLPLGLALAAFSLAKTSAQAARAQYLELQLVPAFVEALHRYRFGDQAAWLRHNTTLELSRVLDRDLTEAEHVMQTAVALTERMLHALDPDGTLRQLAELDSQLAALHTIITTLCTAWGTAVDVEKVREELSQVLTALTPTVNRTAAE